MTTTPCGSRTTQLGATYDCDQPAGHSGNHVCHTSPEEWMEWVADASAPKGPVHTLGIGAEPAPRQARRDTIRYILDRLDRGLTLTENERLALRNRITAEQADGDQAREQLAADPLLRMLDSPVVGVAALGAAAHEHAARMVREANERAEQAQQTARDARRGEAEAVRARAAAEAMLTRVRALLPDNPSQDRWTDTVHAASLRAALGDPQPATEPETEGDTCGCCGHHTTWHRDAGARPCHKIGCPCGAFTAQGDHRCCVCGSPEVGYHNYREQPFCWPCANGDRPVPVEATTPEPDPCAHGCRQAADDLTRLGQEIDAEAEQPAEPEPDAPCFHPSWETEPTVGARKCTDCGEWLDPEPPAEPVGAALWATIRDHAARDHQFWTDLNRDWERQYRQGVRL